MPVYFNGIDFLWSSKVIIILLVAYIIASALFWIAILVIDLRTSICVERGLLALIFIVLSVGYLAYCIQFYKNTDKLYLKNTNFVVLENNRVDIINTRYELMSDGSAILIDNDKSISLYRDSKTRDIYNVDSSNYLTFQKVKFKVNKKWYMRDSTIKEIESRTLYRLDEICVH